jgi:hypothetical protein
MAHAEGLDRVETMVVLDDVQIRLAIEFDDIKAAPRSLENLINASKFRYDRKIACNAADRG